MKNKGYANVFEGGGGGGGGGGGTKCIMGDVHMAHKNLTKETKLKVNYQCVIPLITYDNPSPVWKRLLVKPVFRGRSRTYLKDCF